MFVILNILLLSTVANSSVIGQPISLQSTIGSRLENLELSQRRELAQWPRDMGDKVEARVWEHFNLLNQMRKRGATCGSKHYPGVQVDLEFDCLLWRASKLHSR